MDKDERIATGREGRNAFAGSGRGGAARGQQQAIAAPEKDDLANMSAVAAPPGASDVQYASLAGNQ